MTDQWGRFEQSAGRTLTDLGFGQTLEVYLPTETPVAGEGYDISYPSSPDYTVDAEITTPSADGSEDQSGLASEADVAIYVDAASAPSWRGYEAEDQAAIRVVDITVSPEVEYEIESAVSEHNGLLRLAGVER